MAGGGTSFVQNVCVCASDIGGIESLLHIHAEETSLIESVGSLHFRVMLWFKFKVWLRLD